jgi:hypothetical protein
MNDTFATSTTPDTSATEMLRGLSSDSVRARLRALDAEIRALRTLLRATIRMEQRRTETAR